jgi:hypothetical protein
MDAFFQYAIKHFNCNIVSSHDLYFIEINTFSQKLIVKLIKAICQR